MKHAGFLQINRIVPFCIVGIFLGTSMLIAQESSTRETYCNPLPLPNYPIGKFARSYLGRDTGQNGCGS